MVWVPGTDYPPAQQHVGYPVSVLPDGTDTGATPLPDNEAVIGWRSGCDCGWRGRQFYPRAEWPSPTGEVPTAVEGWEGATATCVNGSATSNKPSRNCRSTNWPDSSPTSRPR